MKSNLDSSHLLIFIFDRFKIFFAVGVIAAIVSSVVSLSMEEKYESSVIMFATTQSSIGEQFYEESKQGDLLAYGESDDAERLLQLLNSGKVRANIINKFNLSEHYGIDLTQPGSRSTLNQVYNSSVNASKTRFGSIKISVLDKDPEVAKNVANSIVNLTDSLANSLRNERAQQAYALAKSTYEKAVSEIQNAENELGELHEQGIYDFEAQVEGLTAQYGTAVANRNLSGAKIIKEDLDKISKLANKYNELVNFLEPAYEQLATIKKRLDLMKVDAETQIPSSLVVDYAEAADKKSYPVRWMIVVVSVLSTLAMTLILLLALDSVKSAKQ